MDFAKLDRFIDGFYADDSRLQWNKWNYADGCLALAAVQLYRATGKEQFKDYALNYADRYVLEDGTIRTYKQEDYKLDDVLPGRALFFAWEQTGEERYHKAIESLGTQLAGQPRTASGNYWHKKIYPNQVWLDGLFMAQPFRMTLDASRGSKDQYLDVCNQFENVRKNMRDPKTGLYFHGYDESKSIFWADPESGCSQNFWLRAMGWYLVSLIDTMEEMDRHVYDYLRPLQDTLREALQSILKYQDPETGLFWQVIDRADLASKGNYLETSGSAMVAATIFKASRLRLILGEKYLPAAEKILDSLIRDRIVEKDGKLVMTGTCAVAGLGPDPGRRDGSLAYYFSEPVVDDDNKGVAALCMAYAQYLLYKKWEVSERWKA